MMNADALQACLEYYGVDPDWARKESKKIRDRFLRSQWESGLPYGLMGPVTEEELSK